MSATTHDPFDVTKTKFKLPEGVIYLDGNSLGPLPVAAKRVMADALEKEWGQELIRAWNTADWISLPARLGDAIGRLVGAPAGTVMVGDTLTLKVNQALSAALSLRPDRRVILSDIGNFPADLYMAQGLIGQLGWGHELKTPEPQDVLAAIDETVGVVMLTEVDYRTGRKHDMKALTKAAHDAGALIVWDLAHSAGAIEVDLLGAGADFAVGCTYKYLNGGPGAPAFIYVADELLPQIAPALSGWMGHAAPFEFDPDYRPAPGIARMRIGTPPILAMRALEAALEVWEGVDMRALRKRSIELSEAFVETVEANCPELVLFSPRDAQMRGSQVSFRHPQGYAIMQALIANGVIGDFRAPDSLRFGFTPLYLSVDDVQNAAGILSRIMREREWDSLEFHARKAVT